MEVIIFPTRNDVARYAADNIENRLVNPLTMGFPHDTTSIHVYKELIRRQLDFSRLRAFNIDDLLSTDTEESFRYQLMNNFFDKINIPNSQIHLLDSTIKEENIETYCRIYEGLIENFGGIDYQLLGLGMNGHIAYNEPGSPFSSRTRKVTLAPDSIASLGKTHTTYGITMGIGTILQYAKEITQLVIGPHKADIVEKVIEGPITEEVPATALRTHDKSLMILDKQAASKLKHTDRYRYAA